MGKTNILLVDDNTELFYNIDEECSKVFKVSFSLSDKLFSEKNRLEDFQVIIINYDLKMGNGFKIYKQLHKVYLGPIIFVSAVDDVDIRIEGLEMGADAFILLPCNCKEMILLINKILMHLNTETNKVIGEYKIDSVHHKISYKGKGLKLAPIPYRLLSYLLENPNIDISRNQLLQEVWGYKSGMSNRLIDTNISHIRQLTQDGNIKSIRGVGYRYTFDE